MSVQRFSLSTHLQARALLRLGRGDEARRLLEDLLAYAREEKTKPAAIDYFATSLPELLLFEADLNVQRAAHFEQLESQALSGLREIGAKPARIGGPRIEAERVAGQEAVRLTSEALEVVVIPELGGKIVSLRDRATGREWLWSNPYLAYNAPRYGDSYIEAHDTGGIDECFPNVDPSTLRAEPYEGVFLPDHGELFGRPFVVLDRATNDHVATLTLARNGIRLPYRFERSLTLHGERPRLDLHYRIENVGSESFPITYCLHPIFHAEPGMRIEIEGQPDVRSSFCVDDDPAPRDARFVWPRCAGPKRDIDLSVVPDLEKTSPFAAKLFLGPLARGSVRLVHPATASALHLRFDARELPFLALWLNYGRWSGAGTPPYYNLVVEPSMADAERLEDAVERGTAKTLAPGQEIRFSISLALESPEPTKEPRDVR